MLIINKRMGVSLLQFELQGTFLFPFIFSPWVLLIPLFLICIFKTPLKYQYQYMNKQFAEALVTLQNSKETEIPPYSQEMIELGKNEIKRLLEMAKQASTRHRANLTADEDMLQFEKTESALLFDQIYRIKRFLLIYHDFRCDRIEDQFWTYGGDLKNTQKGHISAQEKAYFNEYKGMVMDYIEETKVELTIDLDPPLETEVEYRMLEDCGEILDDFGHMVKLEKNSYGLIRRRLIEKYAKQGSATIKKK